MKPKYARMPPTLKTEEDRLCLRILQLEAEVAYLKELRKFRLQEEVRPRNYPKVKSPSFPKSAIRYCRLSTQYVIQSMSRKGNFLDHAQ